MNETSEVLPMQLGLVGLGKMGGNMAMRLIERGFQVVGHDHDEKPMNELESGGGSRAGSVADLVSQLRAPRAVWIMVPAGGPTESVIAELVQVLEPGDTIIDGGNSHFKDDVRRSSELAAHGIKYLDVGTSGGLWGYERGYCLMIGGDPAAFQRIEPIFEALAPGVGDIELTPGRDGSTTAEKGYIYCGKAGAGHYVKMIHNGIEYGMMQAFAEGFDIMHSASSESLPEEYRYDFSLPEIAEVWRRGSVVSSWLLDLTAIALTEQPDLGGYAGYVKDSGEGRWTVEAAVDQAVPAVVLTAALYARFRSRREGSFADKVLSAMRFQFGGHTEGQQKNIKSSDNKGAGHETGQEHV